MELEGHARAGCRGEGCLITAAAPLDQPAGTCGLGRMLTKEEQKKRLLDRIDTPDKNWKIKAADIEARKHGARYREAYQACLSETSTHEAPWYIVPADDKLCAHLFVSHIILGKHPAKATGS